MKLRFGWTVPRSGGRQSATAIRVEHVLTAEDIAELLALWRSERAPEGPTFTLSASRIGEITRQVLSERGSKAFEVPWGDYRSQRDIDSINQWARRQVSSAYPDEARKAWGPQSTTTPKE